MPLTIPTDARVLFDGSKTFWKIRRNLRVVVVEHTKQRFWKLLFGILLKILNAQEYT